MLQFGIYSIIIYVIHVSVTLPFNLGLIAMRPKLV